VPPSTTSTASSSADPKRWLAPVALAALVLLFAWRSFRTHRVFNDTADEAVHIACGLEVFERGRYTLEAQHPPLARVVLAALPYGAGLRLESPSQSKQPKWTSAGREFYWRTLSLARLGNLLFVPFLLAYVYLWGQQLYGRPAAIAAAALVSLSPNLLAHASLATLDFAAATTIFISSYYLWRWSRRPGPAPALAAAAAFSIAVLTKFSALFVLPLIGAALFALARRWPGRSAAAAFAAAVLVLVWGAYGFEAGPLPPPQFERPNPITLDGAFLPAPRLVRGVLDVLDHNAEGHHCYLLGRLSHRGWWYYFPVVVAVKTTLPLLLLAALALFRGPPLALALPPAILLAVAMTGNLNLGVRHILALYPFLGLLAAGLFTGPRALMILAGVLAGWHAAESLRAHPDYLPYFNQIARGHEERFLLDSNLDWGQDLERLRLYLEQNRVESVYLSYFGRADPARLGIRGIRPLPPDLRPAGWVAVSKAHVAGLALDGYNLGWLRAHTPAARIGKSILVYYFRTSAESARRPPARRTGPPPPA